MLSLTSFLNATRESLMMFKIFTVLGFVSVSSLAFADTVAAPAAALVAPGAAAGSTPAAAPAICATDNGKYVAALQALKAAVEADRAANLKVTEARKALAAELVAERSDNKAEARIHRLRRAHMGANNNAVLNAGRFDGALASAQAQLDLLKKSGSVLSKEDLADAREERNELNRVIILLSGAKTRALSVEAVLVKLNCKVFKPFAELVTFDFTKLDAAKVVVKGIDEQLKALDAKAAPAAAPVAGTPAVK
jgi:hypothetical protein